MDKRFLRAALALGCLCAVAAAQQQRRGGGGLDNLSLPSTLERAALTHRWVTFAPEGEVFSVAMPEKPTDVAVGKSATVGSDAGQPRSYRLEADQIEYEIARTGRKPQAFFDVKDFEGQFLAALKVSLSLSAQHKWPHMKLELSAHRPASVDGFAGHEFDLDSAHYRARVRAFIIDRSLLFVSMTGPRSAFSDAKVDKFFGSLRLTAR